MAEPTPTLRPEDQEYIDGLAALGADHINWLQPIEVTMLAPGGPRTGFVCRICVARLGLRGDQHERLMTIEGWQSHMKEEHLQ